MSWQHLNQPQGWIGVISISLSLSLLAKRSIDWFVVWTLDIWILMVIDQSALGGHFLPVVLTQGKLDTITTTATCNLDYLGQSFTCNLLGAGI